MNSGELRHKIDLYTVNEQGNETYYKSKMAAIRTSSATRTDQQDAFDILVTYQIIVRYSPDIEKTMIIKRGERKFKIESLYDENEKHEWLVLTCIEVA